MNEFITRTMAAVSAVALLAGAAAGGSGTAIKTPSQAYSIENLLAPVWEGNESYQESVLVVEEADGSVAPIRLLYPIGQIRSVKSASLETVYKEGIDYSVADGQLVILPTGSIPCLTYEEFHPQTGTAGFEDRDGGYVLWKEGSWFHDRQIVVTYTHTQAYTGYIPEGKGKLLPELRSKLTEGGSMNMLVYGDSISEGGNSSGSPLINVPPYMPIYPELFAEGLELRYGLENVNVINASVGGKDSNWGISEIRTQVFERCTDLDVAIVAFGMNDTTRDAKSYAYNIKRIVSALTKKYPGIAVLMVAPMLPNYQAQSFWGHQAEFYDALKELEGGGVVAVDVTGMHASLLNTKRYADMTGNNVNHASDYLARIYAQTLLRTLEESDYGASAPGEGEQPLPDPDPGDGTGEERHETDVSENGGLGTGAVVGIAAGSAAALCLIAVAVVMLIKNKNRH